MTTHGGRTKTELDALDWAREAIDRGAGWSYGEVGAIAGFIALTLGTALFVAAEFSLTALEKSTVDADVLVVGTDGVGVRTLVEAHHKGDSLRRARTMVAALEGVAIASLNVAEPEREAFLADTIGMLLQAMTDLETA